MPVDLAPLAFGFVVRKQLVEMLDFVEGRICRRLHLDPVIPIHFNGIGRTHGVGALFETQKFLVGRHGPRKNQKYHNLFNLWANFRYGHEFFSHV